MHQLALIKTRPMSHNHTPRAMSQKIFNLGLPVETVSAYLLCCGLEDAGETITTKHLLNIWNSSKEVLEQALGDLEEKHILQKIISDRKEKNIYKLNNEKKWKNKK